ncbi:MAG: DNA repair protein RecO [Planctomycetaceae bacterium]
MIAESVSTEKAEALVIRQADFSESSRVVTFFSREFGKISCLAKGAKRLKGPFDAALDLLSACRIVFLQKTSGALNLLTQAELIRRFAPAPHQLMSLYSGYYLADLLNRFTEEFDPNATLYDAAEAALNQLADADCDYATVVLLFEVRLLVVTGHFPSLAECIACGEEARISGRFAHWVSQGGLLCEHCRRQEYAGKSVSAASVNILRSVANSESMLASRLKLSKEQIAECHRLTVSIITSVLGKVPGTLRYLNF